MLDNTWNCPISFNNFFEFFCHANGFKSVTDFQLTLTSDDKDFLKISKTLSR